jgi:hypothetical protein
MTLCELITSLKLPYFSMFLFDNSFKYTECTGTNLKDAYDVYNNTIDVLMYKNGKEFFVNDEDEDIGLIKNFKVLEYAKVLENDADNCFKVLLKI